MRAGLSPSLCPSRHGQRLHHVRRPDFLLPTLRSAPVRAPGFPSGPFCIQGGWRLSTPTFSPVGLKDISIQLLSGSVPHVPYCFQPGSVGSVLWVSSPVGGRDSWGARPEGLIPERLLSAVLLGESEAHLLAPCSRHGRYLLPGRLDQASLVPEICKVTRTRLSDQRL